MDEFADTRHVRTIAHDAFLKERLELLKHQFCARCHTEPATCLRSGDPNGYCRACVPFVRAERAVTAYHEQRRLT